MERLKQRLEVAQRALETLKEVLSETNRTVILRDAAIQRFEYTFEYAAFMQSCLTVIKKSLKKK
jgi:predicted PP-loop superfamily ATPase